VRTHRYWITIAGGLGDIGREAFSDFAIESNGTNTVLTGDLDQAALHGTLNRIMSLGFELVELGRLTDREKLSRHSDVACLISMSSMPSARTRLRTSRSPLWSRSLDKTVTQGSTFMIMSANASLAAGPGEPMTLIS
jgi:hypothetical protein